ncbi:GH1 family beta-glucosidase [Dactylosporangium fulvum]|uniref:Beta-glucosidase n=1 Tax=Dactylosporangium fulvum TaxID=53359 RepID=A0ABY5VTD4_9ACTN|nr:GH1 family beta-glucosidase [Dactylosporangium fulvum]UWP80988.1 GH1 family beta-glucosidase [Dactylosporangium fulvum]
MLDLSALPPDFIWGAATAAYQIEGAVAEDGRKPSIWDTFSRIPGAVDNGDTGDVACDHYHRWPEDIGLMRRLNLDAYRFSVAWPRIFPDGVGQLNQAGLDFYDRLVDGLLAEGIRPFATMYHWDLPQALQDAGGWPNRATAEAFADYAAVVAARLGDRVADWNTVNEPLCVSWIGHLEGRMAPGERNLARAVHTSHHVLLGHGLVNQAIRASAKLAPSVGIVFNLSPIEPGSDRPEDVAAATRADGHVNRWWLDPVFGRGYPADMIECYGVEPPVRDGDLDLIGAPTEFLGINYYFRQIVVDDPLGAVPFVKQIPVPGSIETAMPWEVYAKGLEDILVSVAKTYGPRSIIVTENGSAWDDTVEPTGEIQDKERTDYLEQHLDAVRNAVLRGAPVDGYFAWSLLDNFEWAYGYDKRFGLVHVDYETQERTIKASGHRYADLVTTHKRSRESA